MINANEELFEFKDIQEAYKKYKSYVYYNNTDINNKIKIADFESKLTENLKKLQNVLNSGNGIEKYIKDISYYILPKSFINFNQDDDVLISNKNISNKYELKKYNFFISMPVELHIIDVLWIMKLGYILDKDYCEYTEEVTNICYANRLHFDNNKQKIVPGKRLFKSYIHQYNDWRDNCISTAEKALDNNKDVTIFSLDITGYFNNVKLDFTEVNEHIQKSISNNNLFEKYSFLTEYLEKIRTKYVDEIKKDFSDIFGNQKQFKETLLPIGSLSSGILANWYLYKFDMLVLEELNPLYYGRYVDDILIVIESKNICNKECLYDDCKQCLSLNNFITKYLDKIIDCKDNAKDELILKIFLNLNIQKTKLKIFNFDHNASKSLLLKFKENIRRHSSEFRFLPEDDRLYNDFAQENYSIDYSDSINKLRSIEKYRLDKFKISTFLAKQLSISKYIQDPQHFKKIQKELSYSFSGKIGLELYAFWYKVLIYIVMNNNYETLLDFIQNTIKAIDKITYASNKNLQNKIQLDLKEILYNSLVIALAYNPSFVLTFENEKYNLKEDFKMLLLSKDVLTKRDFINDVKNVINSNIFRHDYCFLPYITFLEFDQNKFINLVNPNILADKNLINSSIWKNDTPNKIKKEYSPCYIKYSDIQLFKIYQNIITSKHSNLNIIEIWNEINSDEKNIRSNNICINLSKTKNKNECIIINNKPENNKINLNNLLIGIYNTKISDEDIKQSLVGKEPLTFKYLLELMSFLNKAIDKHYCNIIVFPEISIPLQYLELLQDFSRRKNIAIVAGLQHTINNDRKVYNFITTILPFKNEKNSNDNITILRNKKFFAPHELEILKENNLKEAKSKEKNYLFNWNGLCFACYDCYELADIKFRSQFKGQIDMLFACEWNKDTNYFDKIVESITRDLHCFVIQVNTSQFGHSKIIAPKSKDEMTILNITGGKNNILVGNIDIEELRSFQKVKHNSAKKYNYKLLPPNYPITDRLK